MVITLTALNDKAVEVLEITTNYLGYIDGETVGTRKEYLDMKVKEYVKSAYIQGKIEAVEEVNRQEEDALRETNRDKIETARQDAEAVNITV